jgi:serine/threonine-protein kinase
LRVELSADGTLALTGGVAVSADGKALVFVGRPANSGRSTYAASLYVRHLDRLDAELLQGTESGQAPFFSPDGEWVAFFANETLKKVATRGGPVVSITAVTGPRGGWWGDDDTIVFASTDGLSRVRASGGTPEVIIRPSEGQPPPTTPQLLPKGRGILYVRAANSDPADGTVLVQDLDGGAPREILRGGRVPRYVGSGHLTFVRSGTLFAAPFDLESLSMRGEAVPIVEGVFQAPVAAIGNFAISDTGVLAYQPGGFGQQQQAPVMWLAEAGVMSPLRSAPSTFGFPRFSPDGRRLAMAISDSRQTDIWVYDYDRDILTRVTADPGTDLSPVWLPDGSSLIYGSNRGSNASNLYWQRADGTGSAVRLTTSMVSQLPDSIDPQGRRLVVHEGDPATGRQSITTLTLDRDASGALRAGATIPLISGPFLKANARISPDGQWLAYAANDTGVWQIYVQPFPGPGERVQVSNDGGNLAVWSATKSELYYVGSGATRLMAVPYSVKETAFSPTRPRAWAPTMFSATPPIVTYGPGFDVHPDGRRFVVAPLPDAVADSPVRSAQLIVVFNFLDELRRRMPIR